MGLLDKLKKFNRDHDPNKPKPSGAAAGFKKEGAAKAAPKVTAKVVPKTPKAVTKKTPSVPKNVPIPASKPKSGKTAQVAAKTVVKDRKSVNVSRESGSKQVSKAARPSLGIVPKGRKYSGGILDGMFAKKKK